MNKQRQHAQIVPFMAAMLGMAALGSATDARAQEILESPPPAAQTQGYRVVARTGGEITEQEMRTAGFQLDPKYYVASPASIEGKLRAEGNSWVRVQEPLREASYVEDTVRLRPNQPPDRGAIGKVCIFNASHTTAWVDFGRGWIAQIPIADLVPVRLSIPKAPTDWVDSQLAAQGKGWQLSGGTIHAGDYVEDILKNRLGQHAGRGQIAKVVSLYVSTEGNDSAWVDFGHDCTTGIMLSELATVRIIPAVAGYPVTASAAQSVETQLIAQGKRWIKTPGQIKAGDYVKDILEGRLGQPAGRGNVAKVISLSADGGFECAWVDFGRNWVVPIATKELCPIRFIAPDGTFIPTVRSSIDTRPARAIEWSGPRPSAIQTPGFMGSGFGTSQPSPDKAIDIDAIENDVKIKGLKDGSGL